VNDTNSNFLDEVCEMEMIECARLAQRQAETLVDSVHQYTHGNNQSNQ